MDQSEAALVAISKLAIHLSARIDTLESLLVDKKTVTKEEIQSAASLAENRLVMVYRSLPGPSARNFGSDLTTALETLLGGAGR
jgi:hypothetical protein